MCPVQSPTSVLSKMWCLLLQCVCLREGVQQHFNWVVSILLSFVLLVLPLSVCVCVRVCVCVCVCMCVCVCAQVYV